MTDELADFQEIAADRDAALAREAALTRVLELITRAADDPTAVYDAILEEAIRLCGPAFGGLSSFDGEHFRIISHRGMSPAWAEYFQRPYRPSPGGRLERIVRGEPWLQVVDIENDPYHPNSANIRAMRELGGARTVLWLGLRRGGTLLGLMALLRPEVRPFDARQIGLVQAFAAQAVIAMENARLLGELRHQTEALAARNSEYSERIEQQAATIDVLKVMSTSPGDPQPVFDLITQQAMKLCNGMVTGLFGFDGGSVHLRSFAGLSGDEMRDYRALFPMSPNTGSTAARAILEKRIIHVRDIDLDPEMNTTIRRQPWKSALSVPLMRNDEALGSISLGAEPPGGFTDSQVELVKTFAEQAVIAITSAETYRELQDRTAALAQRNSEFGERIEQQAATIDVLKVMSASPDDTRPVFDQIARRVQELCNGQVGAVFEYDGTLVHLRSVYESAPYPVTSRSAAYQSMWPMPPSRESIACQAILDKQIVHVRDVRTQEGLHWTIRGQHSRSQVSVPLMREDAVIGAVTLAALEPGGFTDSQIALLQTFAEQAVIAIGSVATFRALRERTAELTRSVAELQALEETIRAINASLDLDIVLSTIISRAVQLSQADEGTIYEYDEAEGVFLPKAAHGMTEDRVAALRERRIRMGETHLGRAGATRAPVHVSDVQQDTSMPGVADFLEGIHAVLAVPLLREDKVIGGLVIRRRTAGDFAPTIPTLLQTFAGQSVLAIENARLFEQLTVRQEETRRARESAEAALEDLRKAQDRLVQTEKMASLGQLTAGIAHEIKNPLNFVNNFSDLSVDLLNELHEAVAPDKITLAADLRAEIDEITETLKGNLQKIAQHGRRADSIVKNMLLHSRTGVSEQRSTDINALAEEALNLAYHGARAEFPGFNVTLERDLDPGLGTADIFPQEVSRVLLNLIGNGFYATRKRADRKDTPGYEPTLRLSTRNLGDAVEIRVRDNGTGIPPDLRDKIFEPFFTTKPAGEGTGLGLSLSFDIVVKQHGGQLHVDSQTDRFTEFTITLPRTGAGARP